MTIAKLRRGRWQLGNGRSRVGIRRRSQFGHPWRGFVHWSGSIVAPAPPPARSTDRRKVRLRSDFQPSVSGFSRTLRLRRATDPDWCYAQRTRCQQGTIMDIGAELRAAREAKGLSSARWPSARVCPHERCLPSNATIDRLSRLNLLPGDSSELTQKSSIWITSGSVREYFAQFPAEAPTGPLLVTREIPDASWQPPSRWLGMATSVAILLVVVTAAVVLGRRGESHVEPGTVGTTGNAPASPAPAPARLTSRLSRQRSQQTPVAPAPAATSAAISSFCR